MNETVDVLIIGSGASGAAVAWSLAETKMRILCLEQGDWMKPADYPSNGRDWEARLRRLRHQPEHPRDAADGLSDQRRRLAASRSSTSTASAAARSCYTGHYPRLHPSDFRVKSLDGVADDWPIDYATLEPFFAENDRMTGVSGLAGDPAYPPKQPPMPPLPLGSRRHLRGNEQARLALVAVRHVASPRPECEGRAPCINLGHCTPACAQGAKASTDITYWPRGDPRRGGAAHALPGARDHLDEHGMASGAIYYDADGRRAVPAGRGRRDGVQRRRHAAAPAELAVGAVPEWARQFRSGLVGKNLMFHPYAQVSGYFDDGSTGERGPPTVPVEQGVLRDRC